MRTGLPHGKPKINPPGVRRVTKKEVEVYARVHNFKIHNDGLGGHGGFWWLEIDGAESRLLGMTNYLALEAMEKMVKK